MSDNYTMVRYSHLGDKFEILVDPDKGLAYKQGKLTNVSNALMIDTIFTDAKKGEKPTKAKLEEVFGTTTPSRWPRSCLRREHSCSRPSRGGR